MRTVSLDDAGAIARLLDRDAARDPRVARQAARIVADVKRRGDAAVRQWRRRLGDVSVASVTATRDMAPRTPISRRPGASRVFRCDGSGRTRFS